MSQSRAQTHPALDPASTTSSSSNFQAIFCDSWKEYEQKTKKNLLAHPLTSRLQSCNSPTDILAVLYDQVPGFDPSRRTEDRFTRWLGPTVNVLYAFATTLNEGVGLVFSPAKVIFAGAGVLLLAAKDAVASREALIDMFEQIESFFKRLETYTEVPTTESMRDIIVKIMVEVLDILAISTKEIKQGRTKKCFRKLIGRTDIEDALKRLNKLTQEEARMAIAQVLKVTHHVDNGVKNISDIVGLIGTKVNNVDDKVKVVIEEGNVVKETTTETRALVQHMANNIEEAKWTQLRQELRKWVSPPDPSTNHNIACEASHKQTAEWFFEGNKMNEWKSTGSLLWIHGKPGAGKSILCSSIIQDAIVLREAGLASVAYFYFDFRDTDKQSRHDLLTSLVYQLSARSDPCCEILFRLYVGHDNGAEKPGDGVLVRCLKEMLAVLVQSPTYIIVDALDESPITSGIPSARARVIELVKELLGLRLPNLRACITSRPETDIKAALGPLASHSVSLHDEIGQNQDIADYIKSVVYSDSDTMMSRWREDEKKLVIETLSERADGMFRWVFCQLEALQDCLPASIRRTLKELPESLDETYKRILREIKKPDRDQAHRLLQYLVVAVRPLRAEELAELLAFDFDATNGDIPKFNPDWRWGDQEQALLSTCSSLIAVVDDGHSRIVQFSHFSVKEFLTSDRLVDLGGDISRYHISSVFAHTVVAQACVGILLSLGDDFRPSESEGCGCGSKFPLAGYAAQYWRDHAQSDEVSLRIQDGMQQLFDPNKPHFAAWTKLHNVDYLSSWSGPIEPMAAPLYRAAFCGFREIVGHLLIKYPEYACARGGFFGTALHSASRQNHVEVVQLLLKHGIDADVRGVNGMTPLHIAANMGHVAVARCLLDPSATTELEHNTDVNPAFNMGPVQLYEASGNLSPICDNPHVMRSVTRHSADLNAVDEKDRTPLRTAVSGGKLDVVRLLLDHGANPNVEDEKGRTLLHIASSAGRTEVARLLLDRGASTDARDKEGSTPLHVASSHGTTEVVRLLLDRGADANSKHGAESTPLHFASFWGRAEAVRLLLDSGAIADVGDKEGSTPLCVASSRGQTDVVRLLLNRGTTANSEDKSGSTPLHLASSIGKIKVVHLLLDHGANAAVKDKKGRTPLHLASFHKKGDVVRLLLDRGANVNTEDRMGSTPMHLASSSSSSEETEIVRLLLERGANADAQDKTGNTPLHLASFWGRKEVLRLFLDHCAIIDVEDNEGRTPLRMASSRGNTDVVRLLLNCGTNTNAVDRAGSTPLHVASFLGQTEVVSLLLQSGANVHVEDKKGRTPLHIASAQGKTEVMHLLLDYGVNATNRK